MSKPRVLDDIDYLDSQSTIHAQHISSLQESVLDIQRQMSVAVRDIEASEVSIGQEVYLYEGDVLTPFIVVQKDYIDDGNVILIRKYPLPQDYIGTAVSGYINSYIDTYLEDTYRNLVDAGFSTFMLPASNQNGTSNPDDRAVFLPSYAELSGRSATVAGRTVTEGSQFEYFRQGNSVIALHNNYGVDYFLRTPYDLSSFYIVTSSGSYSFSASRDEQYIRPCISIMSTSSVYIKIFDATPDTSNTYASAVVTP